MKSLTERDTAMASPTRLGSSRRKSEATTTHTDIQADMAAARYACKMEKRDNIKVVLATPFVHLIVKVIKHFELLTGFVL